MKRNRECPNCGRKYYKIVDINLLSNDLYQRKFQCKNKECKHKWEEKTSLLDSENKYKFIFLPKEKILYQLHRWVYEQKYKRRLTTGEIIHHKNSNRGDNRASNLDLVTASRHAWLIRERMRKRICPKCKSIYFDRKKEKKACYQKITKSLHR